jgi:arylsulfatase A-like enzyme
VGPGVEQKGRFGEIFTDHTDIRPTILSLAGLKDDYAHDGRVLFEIIDHEALPSSLRTHQETLSRLAAAYKDINAPRGTLGAKTLQGLSTDALEGNDETYGNLETKLTNLTAERDDIAGDMIELLENAAFNKQPINEGAANRLIERAEKLLASVR